MAVALALAAATACDWALKPVTGAAQGGQAAGRRGAGARPNNDYHEPVPFPGGSFQTGPFQAAGSQAGPSHTGPPRTGAPGTGPPTTGPSQNGPATTGPGTTGPGTTGPVRMGPATTAYVSAGAATRSGSGPAPGAAARPAACLPLPSLVSGHVTTQPLLTRLSYQLCSLGVRDIILIAPAGRGDMLTAMAWEGASLAGPGLAAVGNIDVIECASIAAELRAVAAITRRLSESGDAVLICAGDLVAHTEA